MWWRGVRTGGTSRGRRSARPQQTFGGRPLTSRGFPLGKSITSAETTVRAAPAAAMANEMVCSRTTTGSIKSLEGHTTCLSPLSTIRFATAARVTAASAATSPGARYAVRRAPPPAYAETLARERLPSCVSFPVANMHVDLFARLCERRAKDEVHQRLLDQCAGVLKTRRKRRRREHREHDSQLSSHTLSPEGEREAGREPSKAGALRSGIELSEIQSREGLKRCTTSHRE